MKTTLPKTWNELIHKLENEKRPSIQSNFIPCSALPYLAFCGGRYEAEKGIPAEGGRQALLGRACHFCIEHKYVPEDTPMEELEKIMWVFQCLERQVQEGWSIKAPEVYLRFNKVSGVIDLLMERGDELLINEFKFGEQYVPDDSEQVIGNAYLVYANYKPEKLFTCILQPSRKSYNEVEQNQSDVLQKMSDILDLIHEGKRIPSSKTCQFCKAVGTDRCPETQNQLSILERIESALDIEKLKEIYPQVSVMKKAIAKIEELALMYVEKGGTLEGFELKEGVSRRSISDAHEAYKQLRPHVQNKTLQLEFDDLYGKICKVSVGDVEKLLVKLKVCKGKETRSFLAGVLDENIVYKESKPRLVEVSA